MIHGIGVGAVEFDRGPSRLYLFECVEQLDDEVKTEIPYSDEDAPLELGVRSRFC